MIKQKLWYKQGAAPVAAPAKASGVGCIFSSAPKAPLSVANLGPPCTGAYAHTRAHKRLRTQTDTHENASLKREIRRVRGGRPLCGACSPTQKVSSASSSALFACCPGLLEGGGGGGRFDPRGALSHIESLGLWGKGGVWATRHTGFFGVMTRRQKNRQQQGRKRQRGWVGRRGCGFKCRCGAAIAPGENGLPNGRRSVSEGGGGEGE